MKLNEDNYYSLEANKEYCSVSQLKDFIGSPFMQGCEERALAAINGKYERNKTEALLMGSYVDIALTEPENMDKFKEENPELFSTRGATKGLLKSQYIKADEMVKRVKQDKKFMFYMDGIHQQIMTGEIFGLPFKIKIDTYRPGKFISDLKTTESIHKSYWSSHLAKRCDFIEYFGYLLQGAIYQEIVYQNTGERLPFYITAVSKEAVTDFNVIYLPNDELHSIIYGDELREGLANRIEQVRLLKSGEVEPCKCGKCDYCKKNKVLDRVISWQELGGELD